MSGALHPAFRTYLLLLLKLAVQTEVKLALRGELISCTHKKKIALQRSGTTVTKKLLLLSCMLLTVGEG